MSTRTWLTLVAVLAATSCVSQPDSQPRLEVQARVGDRRWALTWNGADLPAEKARLVIELTQPSEKPPHCLKSDTGVLPSGESDGEAFVALVGGDSLSATVEWFDRQGNKLYALSRTLVLR